MTLLLGPEGVTVSGDVCIKTAASAAIIMCANDLPSFLAPLPSPYLILSVAQMEDESRGFVELGYVGR